MIAPKIVPPVCARKCALKPVGLRSRTLAHMKPTENTSRTHTKHTETSQITPGKHKENAWRMQRHIQKTQIDRRAFAQKHRELLGFCQKCPRILPANPQDSARILKGFFQHLAMILQACCQDFAGILCQNIASRVLQGSCKDFVGLLP